MDELDSTDQRIADDDLCARVLKTVKSGKAAVSSFYERAERDLDFASGLADSQYSSDDDKLRTTGRVRQQFSLINQYIERVLGLYDSAPYGVKVNALTEDGVNVAKTTQGIVDAIQANGGAKSAYRTALRNATTCGYGWVGVSTKWESDTDDDAAVAVVVESILDPFAVVLDPASTETDGSDAEWAAYTERITAAKAKALYGDDVLEAGAGSSGFALDPSENVRVEVVTYYERSRDGHDIELGGGVKKRVRERAVNMYRIVNGHLVERRSLALSRVPIIPVYGLPVRYQGENSYVGIVHRARDAQRNLNFAVSTGAERLALSPTMKILAAEEAVAGNEEDYADANRVNNTLLRYKAYDKTTGKAFPAPVKVDPAVDNSDIAGMFQMYSAALSAVIGIPQDGIGSAVGREQTAEETLMRAKAAETVLSTLFNNLSAAVSAVGRVIVETVADAYRGTREYYTTDDDGAVVRRKGDFDAVRLDPAMLSIDIDAGPLLGTQRRENLQSLIALLTISPDTFKPVVFAQACKYVDGVGREFTDQIGKIAAFTMQQATAGAANAEKLSEENANLKQLLDATQRQLAEAQRALVEQAADVRNAETRTRADLLKTEMQNRNRLEVEALKQRGENERAVFEAQADAERDAARAYEKAAAADRAQAEELAMLGGSNL